MTDPTLEAANRKAHEIVRALIAYRNVALEVENNRRTRHPDTGELVRLPTKKQEIRMVVAHNHLDRLVTRYEKASAELGVNPSGSLSLEAERAQKRES